ARWSAPFATLAAAGLAVFLAWVAWMLHHPRPAPRALRRPDWGVLHVAAALAWLAVAALLGLALAWGPEGTWRLRVIPAYGAAGLVGFLAQLVVGVKARVLPLHAWLTAYGSDYARVPPSPHAVPSRALQALTFGLWTAGVPLLAAGLAADGVVWLAAGAWALLAAVLADAAGGVRVVRRLRAPAPAA
ncbi:MAG TPA: hypothetical protein VGC93_09820, partial [Thermoanaerobaculia bacterium]